MRAATDASSGKIWYFLASAMNFCFSSLTFAGYLPARSSAWLKSLFRLWPGFAIWTDCRPDNGVRAAARPAGPLGHPVRSSCDASHSREAWAVCDPGLLNWPLDPPGQGHLLRFARRCAVTPLRLWGPRSRRMPRESLDAAENLSKQA